MEIFHVMRKKTVNSFMFLKDYDGSLKSNTFQIILYPENSRADLKDCVPACFHLAPFFLMGHVSTFTTFHFSQAFHRTHHLF